MTSWILFTSLQLKQVYISTSMPFWKEYHSSNVPQSKKSASIGKNPRKATLSSRDLYYFMNRSQHNPRIKSILKLLLNPIKICMKPNNLNTTLTNSSRNIIQITSLLKIFSISGELELCLKSNRYRCLDVKNL